MSAPTKVTADTAKLPLMLTALRLPTFANLWPAFADRADREGWPAARFLAALAELELAERDRRRIQRHLREARLPMGKTLESFDFAAVPTLSKAHVMALAEGDSWLAKGNNILAFGPPGGGKSHLAAALGHALIQKGSRVLFTRTTDLVQRLQTARQNLTLAQDVAKLDKFHLLILDDLSYVQKDHAETSVLPRARDIETRHSQRHPKRTTEKGHLILSQIGPGVSSSLDPETTHGHAQNNAVDTSPTMSLTIHPRCRATNRHQQRPHQHDIHHRGLVDDQKPAVERIIGVAFEPSAPGIDLKQPVDRRGLEHGGLTAILSTMGIANYLDNWISLLLRFETMIKTNDFLQSLATNVEGGNGPNFFVGLFNIGIAKLSNVNRLENITDQLEEIDESRRILFLTPIDETQSDYSTFINGPWVTSRHSEDFDAADVAKHYRRIAKKTKN